MNTTLKRPVNPKHHGTHLRFGLPRHANTLSPAASSQRGGRCAADGLALRELVHADRALARALRVVEARRVEGYHLARLLGEGLSRRPYTFLEVQP